MVKDKRRSRRIVIARLPWGDHEAYSAEWGEFALCNHVLVVRVSDGQVAAMAEVDLRKYQRATYEEWIEGIMSYLKKVAAKDQAQVGVPSKEGEAFLKSHAALVEYLSAEEFEDGTDRKTSTISVFVENGAWKVCLNDRQAQQTLWVSGASLPDVLRALEALLRAGEGEWRAQKPWTPGKRQKRS